MSEQPPSPTRPRYVWPRFVLVGVILGTALAWLWMSVAIRRTRESRDPMAYPRPNPSMTITPAAATNSAAPKEDHLAGFRDALQGGQSDAGRKCFFERPEANCAKCHKVAGQGGDIGPALDGAGARLTRERILEAILFPNLHTTTNYQSVIVLMKTGGGLSGVLKSEDETNLVVRTDENELVTIRKSDIELRQKGLSPMPEGLGQILKRQDLRDLVEFVASLK